MPSNKEERRSALLQAALDLFAEQGFNGSPTALIAQRAGVASGTLFYHFSSKEELIHELFTQVRRKIDSKVSEDIPEDMPLRQRLVRILSNLTRYFLEHPAEFKFVEQYHFSPLSERGGRLPEENQTVRNLLLRAREERIVKDAPLICLEALAFGPLASLVKEHVNRGTPLDDDVVQRTIQACWDGLKR